MNEKAKKLSYIGPNKAERMNDFLICVHCKVGALYYLIYLTSSQKKSAYLRHEYSKIFDKITRSDFLTFFSLLTHYLPRVGC